MITASEASARWTSASVMPPTVACKILICTSGCCSFDELLADGLDRAAHVGPQDDVERLHLAFLPEPLVERFQRDVRLPAAEFALAGFGGPLLGQLAGLGDVVEHVEAVAGRRARCPNPSR